MSDLIRKIKEVCFAVLPVVFIVLILHFTAAPLHDYLIFRFLIGSLFIIAGLSVFLLGIDIGITPIGNLFGRLLTKPNKLWIIVIGGLMLGFLITVAEPDLQILAGEVESVTSGMMPKLGLIAVVAVGIAVMLSVGLLRIIYSIPLFWVLSGLYLLIFVLSFFVPPGFLAVSFDASGATTGALTVPFILALSFSISALKKDSKGAEKDSFGLVAVASAGAIISVMLMSIISGSTELTGHISNTHLENTGIIMPFFRKLPGVAFESMLAICPLVVLFLIFQKLSFKLTRKSFSRIIKGFVYAFVGLTLFFLGVGAGFMDVGVMMGYNIASNGTHLLIIFVAFALGTVTILAEPAVHVLTHQIEDVTSGSVKRRLVLSALAIGVGLALALSTVRILVPEIKLWHFLLPGYIIAIALTFLGPKLFVGIAFDSGGVASGPMTATFILAFTQGTANATAGADVLTDGFGTIAMVALTPLITLQALGLLYRMKTSKRSSLIPWKKA